MSRHQSKFIPQPKKSTRGKDSDAPRRAVRSEQPKVAPTSAQAHYRPNETFEATFLGHPEGTVGFLRPKGFQKGAGLDLLVDWRDAHNAIHGDKVVAEVAGESFDGRLRGRVVKILSRGENPLPARLQKQPWGWQAVPLEPRLQQIVSVRAHGPRRGRRPGEHPAGSQPGPAAAARGSCWRASGRLTDLKIENKLTAALYNLRTDFPRRGHERAGPLPHRDPSRVDHRDGRICARP